MDRDTREALEVCLRAVLAEELEPAIERALARNMELLGVAASTPEERAEFRKDLEAARKWRQLWDDATKRVGQLVLGSAIVGFLALAGWGVKTQLGK
jgi:hypothetical protein